MGQEGPKAAIKGCMFFHVTTSLKALIFLLQLLVVRDEGSIDPKIRCFQASNASKESAKKE